WYVLLWRAALAIFEGRFDEGERLADEAYAAGRRAEDANAEIFRVVQLGAITVDQERFAEFELPDRLLERLESSSASVAWMTGMSWFLATVGQEDEARAMLTEVCEDELARLPWDANRPACLAELTEAACLLGERAFGEAIERALEPWGDRNVGNARAISFYGSAHYFLGKLAELREVTIDPEAVDPEDVEMLQDLVLAATNEALRSAQELAANRMNSVAGLGGAGGLGGLGLPGL